MSLICRECAAEHSGTAPRTSATASASATTRAFAVAPTMPDSARRPRPTSRIMAHRIPLMLGIGALYSAIEWFGAIDARLRALLQLQAARLHRASY